MSHYLMECVTYGRCPVTCEMLLIFSLSVTGDKSFRKSQSISVRKDFPVIRQQHVISTTYQYLLFNKIESKRQNERKREIEKGRKREPVGKREERRKEKKGIMRDTGQKKKLNR